MKRDRMCFALLSDVPQVGVIRVNAQIVYRRHATATISIDILQYSSKNIAPVHQKGYSSWNRVRGREVKVEMYLDS